MRKIPIILLVLLACMGAYAQAPLPYKIVADTTRLSSGSSKGSTLQILNNTKDVLGFMYNKGNGVTDFRRAAVRVGGTSKYVVGADTLVAGADKFTLNFDSTKWILSNNGVVIDSTPSLARKVAPGSNIYFTVVNGVLYINSTGSGTGGTGTDSLSVHLDSIYRTSDGTGISFANFFARKTFQVVALYTNSGGVSSFAPYKFTPGTIPYAGPDSAFKVDNGGLGYDGTNVLVGHNNPSVASGITLNGSRGSIKAYLNGMLFQSGGGGTGQYDLTKRFSFSNNGMTAYLQMYSNSFTDHRSDFNSNVNVATGYKYTYNNATAMYFDGGSWFMAGAGNTTGTYLYTTAAGQNSQYFNINSFGNTTFGLNTMFGNRYGNRNTVMGMTAMSQGFNSNENTVVGYMAMYNNVGSSSNSAFGYQVMNDLQETDSTVGYNTAIGANAGKGMHFGKFNTIIGANTVGMPYTMNNMVILADGEGHWRYHADSLGNSYLDGYGVSPRTGTPTFSLGVDVNGKIITLPVGSSAQTKTGEENTGSTASTITLANTPITGTVALTKNGVRLPLSQFSVSGAVITLNASRDAVDRFIIDYKY